MVLVMMVIIPEIICIDGDRYKPQKVNGDYDETTGAQYLNVNSKTQSSSNGNLF